MVLVRNIYENLMKEDEIVVFDRAMTVLSGQARWKDHRCPVFWPMIGSPFPRSVGNAFNMVKTIVQWLQLSIQQKLQAIQGP